VEWINQVVAYFFLGKSRTNPDDINDITLYDAYVRELASA
jgi:hypothetical protein